MDLTTMLLLILLVPLASAILVLLFARNAPRVAAALSVGASGLVAALTVWLLVGAWDGETFAIATPWLTLGDFTIELGLLLNGTSAMMLFVVGVVGFFIHVFSLGYMRGEPGEGRYFGGLSIFMFSMLGIVLASNLFMVFIFWELVGFSSYLLIGHYLDRPAAAKAARKAFVVNRIGDFGFLIGIIWTYWHYGTTDLLALEEMALAGAVPALTALGLLLFCGPVGKSAQMPLHVWLPDAMEGPTPVSALIHAATMVAAGVFLLCRIPFLLTVDALHVIAWVGTITAVFAALTAFGQNDIKRILAYSTLSQLGYMVAALGLGTLYAIHHSGDTGEMIVFYGVGAAMFHLTTHAFFKALLFLGSGSIIHACHHEQDIFKMGGLAKRMPVTFATFTIGVIALAGVPYVAAGFFSKDPILYLAYSEVGPIFLLLAFTALLTAAYMGRLWAIAFFGKPRGDGASHAHESSPVMTVPLIFLAVASLLAGWGFFYPETLRGMLEIVPHPHGADYTLMVVISAVAALGGLGLAVLVYGVGSSRDRVQKVAPGLYAVSRDRFYFDHLYGYYVARLQQPFVHFLEGLDRVLNYLLLMRGSALVADLLGRFLRWPLRGGLHGYVFWFFAGAVLYALFAVGVFAF